jgi:DNA-binding transcriptional regulator GbsR (MarR family)
MAEGARDEEAVRRLAGQMSMMLAAVGVPRMAARVLITMTAADEKSLTAGELAERLEVSPAAISGAVRYLVQMHLLERETVPGDRRDHFRMPDDAWYQASVFKFDMLRRFQDLAAQAVEPLGGEGTPAGARMAEMRDFYAFIEEEARAIMERWWARRGELRERQVSGPPHR